MSHLVSEEILRRFSAGTASSEEARLVITHLLTQCSICAERLQRMSGTVRPPAFGYAKPLDRFENGLRQSLMGLPPYGASPEALLAELDRMPPLQQELLVRNSARHGSPELCELLLSRCWAQRFEDPNRCSQSGRLAVLIAHRVEPCRETDTLRIKDLRARSLALWSNALRILGDLQEADTTMAAAHQLLVEGGVSPFAEAQVYVNSGALRYFQRRFTEAIDFYSRAVEIRRDLSPPELIAGTLISQGIMYCLAGKAEVALALLREAIPKIGPGNPELTLMACHNLIFAEIKLGRIEEAMLHWVEVQPLYEKVGNRLSRPRQRWLEGQLFLAQGILPAGLRLLEGSHGQFLEEEKRYEAAMISLDMAPTYLRLGRRSVAGRLMKQAISVFQDLGIQRELGRALRLREICKS